MGRGGPSSELRVEETRSADRRMSIERVCRVVGRAQHLHVEFLQDAVGAELIAALEQLGVRAQLATSLEAGPSV